MLSAELPGYVHRSIDVEGRSVYLQAVPIKLGGESAAPIGVTMAPIMVGAICGVGSETLPTGYPQQFVSASFDAPHGTELLQSYSPELRKLSADVAGRLRAEYPTGTAICSLAVATGRSALAGAEPAEVAIRIQGRQPTSEIVTYVRLSEWVPALCTIFEVGGLPTPCTVLVSSAQSPRLHARDRSGVFGPVESLGEEHRFLVPAGNYYLIPRGLLRPQDHEREVTATAERSVRVSPNWRLGVLEIKTVGANPAFLSVSIRGAGGVMTFGPDQLPSRLDVAPGDYVVQTTDRAMNVTQEQGVHVGEGESRTVVAR